MTNSVVESKRFVVRKSLIVKNQVITFTNKKGDKITNMKIKFNHEQIASISAIVFITIMAILVTYVN